MLNWELLQNPLNWLIVFLMVAIGILGVHTVAQSAFYQSFGNQG